MIYSIVVFGCLLITAITAALHLAYTTYKVYIKSKPSNAIFYWYMSVLCELVHTIFQLVQVRNLQYTSNPYTQLVIAAFAIYSTVFMILYMIQLIHTPSVVERTVTLFSYLVFFLYPLLLLHQPDFSRTLEPIYKALCLTSIGIPMLTSCVQLLYVLLILESVLLFLRYSLTNFQTSRKIYFSITVLIVLKILMSQSYMLSDVGKSTSEPASSLLIAANAGLSVFLYVIMTRQVIAKGFGSIYAEDVKK